MSTYKKPLPATLALAVAFAAALVLPALSSSYESDNEADLIQAVETEFEKVANKIGESIYPQKCTIIDSGECSNSCVYSGYESLPDNSTHSTIGDEFIDVQVCGTCPGVNIFNSTTLYGISGATRSYTAGNTSSSSGSTLSELEPSSNPYDGPEGAQTRAVDEDACWTHKTDTLLSELHSKFSDKLMWVSYVASSGVTRIYPGFIREEDTVYTSRSWYSAALAGPKDVVFLLDQSDSVKRNKVWSKAKYLVDTMIDSTLSAADYVALYAVAGNPKRLGKNPPKNTLERATAATRYSLRSSFCKSGGGGGSRFSVALSRAISLLASSSNANYTSGCAAHIVLVSDADLNERTGKIIKDLSKAAKSFSKDIGRPLHIHVYGLGKYVDENMVRKITCQHNGVFVRIGKKEEVTLEHTRAWLNYVVAERTVAMSIPSLAPKRSLSWSSIEYLKPTNRTGSIISVPVFSSINKSYKYPVGVLAGALYTDEFGNITDDENITNEEYMIYGEEGQENKNALCHNYNLPTTLEQSLRKGYFWYECTHEDMGIKSKNAVPAEEPVGQDSESSDEGLPFEFPLEESCGTEPGVLGLKLCNDNAKGLNSSEFREVYCYNYSDECMEGVVKYEIEEEAEFNQKCSGTGATLINIVILFAVAISVSLYSMSQ